MRILILTLLGIFISSNGLARTVVQMPDREEIRITELDATEFGIYPVFKVINDAEGGVLIFDLTYGIDDREVSSAHITLYSNEYQITNYTESIHEVTYENGTHIKGFGVPLNAKVVTSLEVEFYVEGHVTYVLRLSTVSL